MRRLRWFLFLGLLVFTALSSEAAPKRLTVTQLQQSLAADIAAHKRDSDIAKRLANTALSERIPQATFAQLIAQFPSNSQTVLALRVLANQSEFLDAPASEIAADPAPDDAAQLRILDNTRHYVANTLRGLPNLLATRTIDLYDDRPQPPPEGGWPTRSGLHLIGATSAEVSANRERDDQPATQSSAVWQAKFGLVSGGEFGSTLGMILTEAAPADVKWNHWEKGAKGTLAVFRYSVPASGSHFEIISSFQRETSVEGTRSARDGRGVSGIELRPNINSSNIEYVRTKPAYHGSLWIDPADGSVYRITMEADMSKGAPFKRAAMLVEYGPVNISGTAFICPLRSLAVSESQANAEAMIGNGVTEWLNETRFSNYHRFGSSARIVNDTAGAAAPESATPQPAEPAPPPQPQTPVAETSKPAPPAPSTPAVTPEAPPLEATAEPAPPQPAPAPTKAPDLPLTVSSNAASESVPTFRIAVNSLLVPAVVLDKAGRSVGGLGKQDFVVLDNGKPRAITGFTLLKRTRNTESRTNEKETTPDKTSPDKPAPEAPPSAQNRKRFLIFLFDDRHMTADDLPRVQKAANGLLNQPLAEDDYAAVVSLMGANSGITNDHAVLQAAVAKLSLHQALQHDRFDCPDVDYYSADQIMNHHNAMEFQMAVEKARQCLGIQTQGSSEDPYTGISNPNDPYQRAAMAAATRALAVGEEDARESLASVENVINAMTKLSGERVLILVSSGFLSPSPETMSLRSEIMDLAARNDVVVNALDARGLYAGNLDASQGGSTSTMALVTNQQGQNHLASMQASENAMSELAVGTGGRYFHNNNDLQGGLEMLANVPENSYLLEISLADVKPNGAYHRLEVKLAKPGLEVHARKGYVAPKPAATK
ncbi:VWA domain-containing protein [Occallatibacter riparius]|uniref:VWA domain-containing protein n=1 Tax=Occallatibacter riparius TaxID=1002689 RepID=A0A9J7BLF0_9BACT|nr:VWA domain-containing protein [Occallatibacter riparius]UWZ82602.1 VWA domain-containing protein [Occallatibacter riparius]